jgi:hypothetical protein
MELLRLSKNVPDLLTFSCFRLAPYWLDKAKLLAKS